LPVCDNATPIFTGSAAFTEVGKISAAAIAARTVLLIIFPPFADSLPLIIQK
jgi:uncharacterized membrane protein